MPRKAFSRISLVWRDPEEPARFRTGVSLHSHTNHSVELLDFLPLYFGKIPFIRSYVADWERQHEVRTGQAFDYARAFWRPPFTPKEVLASERLQIRHTLGLEPLNSITDHDSIEAPLMLQVIEDRALVPVSLEWTVPFQGAQFHLGVHNLPPDSAQAIVSALADYTRDPQASTLGALLEMLNALPEVLVVLNHPFSDQTYTLGQARHEDCLREFLAAHRKRIHALELNGLHSVHSNRAVLQLAAELDLPAVSGGDRHAGETNANVNLTNAATFPEFVSEVRRERLSRVAFLPQYREPLALRYLENIAQILRHSAEQAGHEHWTHWIHYRTGSDAVPLSNVLPAGGPPMMGRAIRALAWISSPHIRPGLRLFLSSRSEVVL